MDSMVVDFVFLLQCFSLEKTFLLAELVLFHDCLFAVFDLELYFVVFLCLVIENFDGCVNQSSSVGQVMEVGLVWVFSVLVLQVVVH